jgi:putative tricarboxylic transport membrane protein
MDILQQLLLGLSVILTPTNLMFLTIGALIGMIVGVFPGLGPSAGIAILLPLTFGMDPTSAIVMLAAIYYGTMYGATITAILLNTPGASSVVASTFDGYPLAQQGRAGPALVMQAVASFIGGTVGVILITMLAPLFSRVARSFGPPEFFMVVVLGLLCLVVMLGENVRFGLISALVGFALATVGMDIGTGQPRYTFGSSQLIGGINFIPVAIGIFGLGELLYSIYLRMHRSDKGIAQISPGAGRFWPEARDWLECRFTFVRASLLGFLVGIIPGAGATIASLMAYSIEKSVSKTPQKFGKGAMPGLVASETANNAASAGAMIPLLTLGIPGSASTAVLLGAFLMWGLRPGPLLMAQNPEFAWGLIASMYLGNVILVALCIFAIPVFAAMLRIPYRVLAPIVVVLCVIGTYTVNASMVETWLMLICGVLGLFMKLYGFSPAALVVALVLGPLAEETLRQSLLISGGSPAIFVQRPIAFGLLILMALILVGFTTAQLVRKRRARAASHSDRGMKGA